MIIGPLTLAYFLLRGQLLQAGVRQAEVNLTTTSNALERLTSQQSQRLSIEARLAARIPEVVTALRGGGDVAGARERAARIVGQSAEVLALFDRHGAPLSDGGELSQSALRQAVGAKPLANAFRGHAGTGLWLIEGHLYKLAAEPVRAPASSLQVGTLLLGKRIRPAMAQRLSEADHAEAMILADGSIIGSSLNPAQGDRLHDLASQITSGELQRLELEGELFLVRSETVSVDYGGTECDHLLLESLATTRTLSRQMGTTFGSLGLVTLLAALTLAWTGSRRLTTPLLDSAARMAEMARTGKLQLPETPPAEPEVAAFHDTFRCMLQSLQKSQQEQERSYIETVGALVIAIDARDNDTTGHSFRVARYAERLGRELGIEGEELRALEWGALLHDIGKIAVPDAVLRKAGPLTAEEWHIMHQHPAWGVEMLADVSFLRPALEIIQHHQERWDGMGYPSGLVGDEIPLGARLFAVIDAYDAITSDRPYRRAGSHEHALSELQRVSGSQLDPDIVAAFVRLPREDLDEIRTLRRAHLNLRSPTV